MFSQSYLFDVPLVHKGNLFTASTFARMTLEQLKELIGDPDEVNVCVVKQGVQG